MQVLSLVGYDGWATCCHDATRSWNLQVSESSMCFQFASCFWNVYVLSRFCSMFTIVTFRMCNSMFYFLWIVNVNLLCCNLWVEACKPRSLLAKVGLVITIVTFGIYKSLLYHLYIVSVNFFFIATYELKLTDCGHFKLKLVIIVFCVSKFYCNLFG